MEQTIARRFFPVGAARRGRGASPSRPAPNPGKNKGTGLGLKGSVALSLIRPVTYRVFWGFASASVK